MKDMPEKYKVLLQSNHYVVRNGDLIDYCYITDHYIEY